MTTAFIFTHVDLISAILFKYFVTLSGFVFIKGKFVWLPCSNNWQNSKTNMTKNREIVFAMSRPSLAEGDQPRF